ncbi:MAG: LacI family DNA-binding transcriptional regulator [Xanthomonadales bacterium]|jgi:DNA-binding LacI/PurR family transcriptional regulator|nr:LacI family DNA-binding transcriptional regulator [Xanthomonadales bacterium]
MAGKRAITMEEIAKLAKVSKPTVSRALSDSPLVKPETREHVLSIARRHGYTVNRNAQKLRQKRTATIAVSLDFRSHQGNHIADPFIFDLLAGVSEALGACSQDLLLCAPSHNDAESFQQMLSGKTADGFIVLGQGHREEMLAGLAGSGAPLVVWGAGTPDTPYCVVGSDNLRGGLLAGRHFLQRGRERFLFVGDVSFREIYLRREGLRQAVAESGRDIALTDLDAGNFSFESAYETARRFLASGAAVPDAVFAFSDTAAMAFIRAFREAGLRFPEDVSVVGYNDIPSAEYFSPPLTTVRQDNHQAGRLLVDKLMDMLDGLPAESATIETELIVRQT